MLPLPHMILTAETAGGAMVPGEWITTFVVAVIGALGALWVRKRALREGAQTEREAGRTIMNSPLETKEVPDWATKDDIEDLRKEIKELSCRVETNFAVERETARVAIGNAHKRIDEESKVAAELMGKLNEVSQNVGRLLNLAMQHTKTSGR